MNNKFKILTVILFLSALTSCIINKEAIAEKEADENYTGPPAIVAGTSYLQEIEDVPLPNGFHTNGEPALVYDTPSGRIIEIIAEGISNTEEVEKFYNDALPQLGWKKKVSFYRGGLDMRFNKEDEELRLNIRPDKAKVTIKFSLYPDPGE